MPWNYNHNIIGCKKINLSPLVKPNSQNSWMANQNTFCLTLLHEFKKPIITTFVNLHGQDAINNIDEIDKIFLIFLHTRIGMYQILQY